MSFDAIAWAITQPVGPTRQLVLVHLANFRNDETGQCNPSSVTIAARTGYTERAVRQAFKDLEFFGLIELRRGQYGFQFNLLIGTTADAEQVKDLDEARANDRREKTSSKPQTGSTFRPEASSGRKLVPVGPEASSGPDRKLVPPNQEEKQEEKQDSPPVVPLAAIPPVTPVAKPRSARPVDPTPRAWLDLLRNRLSESLGVDVLVNGAEPKLVAALTPLTRQWTDERFRELADRLPQVDWAQRQGEWYADLRHLCTADGLTWLQRAKLREAPGESGNIFDSMTPAGSKHHVRPR